MRSLFILLIISFILTIVVVILFGLNYQRVLSENGVNFVILDSKVNFKEYTRKFNKSYEDGEYLKRYIYYKASLAEINRLNKLHGSEVFGETKFLDWSPEEKRRYSPSVPLGKCQHLRRKTCPPKFGGSITEDERIGRTEDGIPAKVDWRKEGVVGEVIEQKMCNGCWAMTIVGVMESMWAIQGHAFSKLSIQELIDCGSGSKCHGGDVGRALDYLCFGDFPIVGEEVYPLMLIDESCKTPHGVSGVRVAEFTSNCFMNEDLILRQVATHGPVVAVVNQEPWWYYTSGVIKRACDGEWENLHHAIQIVGYDLTAEVPHYIVRNSWGKDFGEDGYVRVATYGNVCGIASNVAFFSVK